MSLIKEKLSGPPYRNLLGNVWLTRTLFWENHQDVKQQCRYEPVFSLDRDIPGLVNCRSTFIEIGDPTGYAWAQEYLQSWEHWEKLMQSSWFEQAYEGWLREYKMKLRSEAVGIITKIAQEGSQQALQAAKYLASAEWEKPATGRGRPSKEEMKGELARAVKQYEYEQDDAKRIGLTLIQGGK